MIKMKIPKEAKRVFKGVIFEVYHWQQKMFDGSYETYEALKRPNTVQIIATKDGKIILGYEQQPDMEKPLYVTLGGKQEEGEEPLVAAKKELLEEAGLVSDYWELIKIYRPFGKIIWEIYLFVARNCKKVAEQNLDPGEKIELKEVSFDEFVEIVISDEFWGKIIGNDVFRIKAEGRLDELRKKLFPNKE